MPNPTPRTRPVAVTVVAIIAIFFGALGCCCTPIAALPYMMNLGGSNPVIEIVKNKPILLGWTIFSLVFGLVLALALLAGGIGALALKSWARILLMIEAAVSLVMNLLGTAIMFLAMVPVMRDMSGPEAVGGILGGLCAVVLGIALNGSILVVMTRPNVKAAFAE